MPPSARNRVGRNNRNRSQQSSSGDGPSQPGRAEFFSTRATRARSRTAITGDAKMRDTHTGAHRGPRGQWVDLRVTGWDKSKAASNDDGGISSLIQWMEKKASTRLGGGTHKKINVKKVEGRDLFVKVTQDDVSAVLRISGYVWAGAKITISRIGASKGEAADNGKEELKNTFMRVLDRRYNPEAKFLDLSALGQDEDLRTQNIFDSRTATNKFFAAMMAVLEVSFDKPENLESAISSVSLANNELRDLHDVHTLSRTLPKLQNLDLSNNQFDKLFALRGWRKRFSCLQHIILTNNPLEQDEPNFVAELLTWYPNLRLVNQVQVRTEADVLDRVKGAHLPFPIRAPVFHDQNGICQNFVRQFLLGFDTDRAALTNLFYDDRSEFSLSINIFAQRDPTQQVGKVAAEWEPYMPNNRNLKRITHLGPRKDRLFRGTQAIAHIFAALPKTKHPNVDTDGIKYMIEANILPGVPDAHGQHTAGVDGFMIILHGEFEESLDAFKSGKKRSFDRSFIIGPSSNAAGVCVISDILVLRPYAGSVLFSPDAFAQWARSPSPALQPQQSFPSPSVPAPSPEVAQQMVIELSQQTNLTLQMSKECLVQSGWIFETALVQFANAKDKLPPQAFNQPT